MLLVFHVAPKNIIYLLASRWMDFSYSLHLCLSSEKGPDSKHASNMLRVINACKLATKLTKCTRLR